MCEKNISILYKQKPHEVNIALYNTVILKLLKSNMNLQFVTGVYANTCVPNVIFMQA